MAYILTTRGNYGTPWPSMMRFGPRSWKPRGDKSGNVTGSPAPSTPNAASLLPSLIAHGAGLVGYRGLGQTEPSIQTTALGFTVDCSSLMQYVTSPLCWQYSLQAWQDMNAVATAAGPSITTPPTPPPAPANLTTAPASGEEATQTIDSLLSQQMQDWQTQNQQTMSAAATSLQNVATPSINWALWFGVAAVALFGVFLIRMAR